MRSGLDRLEDRTKKFAINEEIDESVFWLEVVQAVAPAAVGEPLSARLAESLELRSIFAKARATISRHLEDATER